MDTANNTLVKNYEKENSTLNQHVTDYEQKQKKDCRVKMLVMSFVTFMLLMIFPLFSFQIAGDKFDLCAMDVGRISFHGTQLTSMREGQLVEFFKDTTQESVEKQETQAAREGAQQAADAIVDFAEEIEPGLLSVFKPLHTVFVLLMTSVMLSLVAFILMIISGSKNMKKTYIGCNIVVAVISVALIVASSLYTSSLAIIGAGLWLGVLMPVLSCITPFIVKKS